MCVGPAASTLMPAVGNRFSVVQKTPLDSPFCSCTPNPRLCAFAQKGVMDRNVLVTVNSDPACHTILLQCRSRSFQKSSTVLTSLQKRDLCNKMSVVQTHNSRENQKLPVKVASHHAATSAPLTSGTGTDPSLSSTPSCHRHTVVAEGLEVVSMLL